MRLLSFLFLDIVCNSANSIVSESRNNNEQVSIIIFHYNECTYCTYTSCMMYMYVRILVVIWHSILKWDGNFPPVQTSKPTNSPVYENLLTQVKENVVICS